MKRYDVYTDGRGDTIREECHDGDWVKYEAALSAIQAAVLAERASCKLACKALTVALDNGGNEYRREATASACVAAIEARGQQ